MTTTWLIDDRGVRRAPSDRGPTYDYRVACAVCGARVGVRVIREHMHIVAPHSPGAGRVMGPLRCAQSERQVRVP